ncbi:MAG: MetQ/NlpA family ABC transporter substrate-binding protein, partial [Longicatena sp.]
MKKILVSLFAVALLAGCGSTKNDDKVIRIGASTTPHAEIIKHVQPVLEKAGYEVIIKEFTDYVKPNQALVVGDLDANFFQHKSYMENWAKKAKETDNIESIFAVHFEPIGIYSVKHTSLDEITEG